MNLSGLLPFVRQAPAYERLVRALREGRLPDILPDGDPSRGLGAITPARPYLAAALHQQLNAPLVILTTRAERVSQWAEQVRVWTGTNQSYVFPEPDALPYERVPWSRETVSDRILALTALLRPGEGRAPVVVASANGYVHWTSRGPDRPR